MRARTLIADAVIAALVGCSTTVITQPSRLKQFLGWTYSVEPLEPVHVDGIPGVPAWAGPLYMPPEPGLSWAEKALVVAIGLVALIVIVWKFSGRAAAVSLMTAPVRVVRKLTRRKP